MKKLMILGASKLQVPAIKKAKEMGIYTIVLDMNPEAVGFQFADTFEVISTLDTESVLECARNYKIDGILTIASDRPMKTVALVAEVLKLSSISKDAALKATNKYEMREALKTNGVPIPLYLKFDKVEKCITALKDLKYPLILKPEDNSGSRGISLVEKFDPDTIADAFLYAKKNSQSGGVLIEEYMIGPEVSVESITIDNKTFVLAITDKITTGAPHFVELGHSQPSFLDQSIQEEIIDITNRTIHAIGITNGPAHTEIIITESGPKVVEIGARMGGDNITSHLVPISTGIDMTKAVIELALGIHPNIRRTFSKGSSIRYFNFDPGKIKNIYNSIENSDKKNLVEYCLDLSVGQTIKTIENSSERYGYVICSGESSVQALENASDFLTLVEIEYF
ncbi:MAG: ATP-grasp domain-containing protein [Firmicutes bacterium]|nr:ATP-grasp domain-containing protein [Bacillota bacterium]